LDEVARNCVDIATDKVGCSVIQKCFDYSGRTAIQLLVFRIIIYSMLLAESPYGFDSTLFNSLFCLLNFFN
jgi:hypothetical protein